MKYFLAAIMVAGVITATARAQAQPAKSPGEIAREQARAVVVIEQLDEGGRVAGQGSGFIVTPGGAIVTSLHVIRGATALRVKLPSGDLYETAEVVDVDEAKDLAVVKIKGFQLPVVRLGDSDRAEVGEPVVVISSPEGLTNSLSTGVISGVRRLETHRVFQITAPIGQGSSGGALFDGGGAVIGIATYLFKAGQNINFAVPINNARGMIADQPTRTLAQLRSAPSPSAPAAAAGGGDAQLGDRVVTAARGRLGREAHEPMFARPDEALTFFYRLVDGIGRYRLDEVTEMTRTAAMAKTGETASAEEFTVKYLSFYSGMTLGFGKGDRVLASAELLVSWSLADLERTFGDKYKRRTVDGRTVLEFNRKVFPGRLVVAGVDANDTVRSVRFTNAR